MNVIEPILFQCRLNPLTTAICVPGSPFGPVTYGTLEAFIHNVARTALKSGIAPGTVAAILVADAFLHTALVLGLMQAGVTTLSLRGPRVPEGINADVVFTDVPGRFTGDATVLTIDQSWLEGDGSPVTQPLINEHDVCRIILTSGSTGVSKGVAFSHQGLARRIAHYTYSKGPRFACCQRLFCDLGVSTSPGFRYAMSMLSRGGTIYFLGSDPLDVLQAIDLHKIQGMATTPHGLGSFLKYFEADNAFDVTFDFIICQGAMLSQELSRRARARMCQNLYSSYGSTETTTVAFGPASALENLPGAVGYIEPGVLVDAIDRDGNTLPILHDGELRIRTGHLADGYVGDPESTKQFFRDGYFYSGDIGHVTADGLLAITGRAKTALNIGGDTVSPERAEEVIASFPGISEAGVFAVNDELGIAELIALIVADGPPNEAALTEHCMRRLPGSCVPARFILVDSLPRGGQGKLERHRLPDIAAPKLVPPKMSATEIG